MAILKDRFDIKMVPLHCYNIERGGKHLVPADNILQNT